MKGYVYILKSLRDSRFYIGSTDNLARRLKEHETGKTKFVSQYISPFCIVFCQEYDEVCQARQAEKWLKAQKDRDFLIRIINEKIIKKHF